MKVFFKPAFFLVLTLFLLHQLVEKIFDVHFSFLDNYLDPFLCSPIMLTFLLFERRVFFRQGDAYTLPLLEVFVATLFIAGVSEILFPYLSSQFTSDWRDTIGIVFGTVYFYFFINVPIKVNLNSV